MKMSEQPSDSKRCLDFLWHFSAYIDQEASKPLYEEIELHLIECADCEIVVDTLRQTISLYRTLPQPEMPERLRERLYRTLDLEKFLHGVMIAPDNNGEKHDNDD